MEMLTKFANYLDSGTPVPDEVRIAILIGCVIMLIAIVIIPTKEENKP
jgi:hypothetical protein